MKCELCSSADRMAGQRLCQPCVEAVARLWTIANRNGLWSVSKEGHVGAEARIGSALFAARPVHANTATQIPAPPFERLQ